MTSTNRLPLLNSCVGGFDEILGGGFPCHSLYMIQGLAGSGKTTLACQIGFAHAAQGKKVLVLTLIAETHAKMLNHLSNFSFFDEELVGHGILFLGGYTELSRGGLRALLKFIAAMLAEHQADILIIDGFRTVRESAPSDLGLSEFMLSLSSLVSSMHCTSFLLSPTEGNVADSENTLVDGVIELSQYEKGMQLIREVKVFKLRGSKHLLGRHVFEVGEHGVVAYPRLEAVSSSTGRSDVASTELLRFGIAGWDALSNGGVVRGSTTELLGNPGVGKTLMGLHFIHEGLQLGEPCLIVGFYESPARLLEKARSVGMDLHRYMANGQLQIIWNPPLEVLVDALAHQVLADVAQRSVTRLLVDGLEGLQEVIMQVGRARPFLTALVDQLRSLNVTSFFTSELPYLAVGTGDRPGTASILFDNIVLMRYVEMGRVNHRQIEVLKLRQNGYNAASHILLISDQGLALGRTVSEELAALADAASTHGRH